MKIPEQFIPKLIDGAIVSVNKPVGPSSHGVVGLIKKITGIDRVGHAGTLDPLASGVLVIGIGRSATKQLWTAAYDSKEYEAEFTLGITSTTDDEQGEKTVREVTTPPSYAELKAAAAQFCGDIKQIPPKYSALKINGTPAYKLARKGHDVPREPRSVRINEIEIRSYEWPRVTLRISCGSGVYIRSLARDMGDLLTTGAYMSKLTRTRVGDLHLADAIPVFYEDTRTKNILI